MTQGHVFKVNKVYMYVHTRKWRMFANLHLCTRITLQSKELDLSSKFRLKQNLLSIHVKNKSIF